MSPTPQKNGTSSNIFWPSPVGTQHATVPLVLNRHFTSMWIESHLVRRSSKSDIDPHKWRHGWREKFKPSFLEVTSDDGLVAACWWHIYFSRTDPANFNITFPVGAKLILHFPALLGYKQQKEEIQNQKDKWYVTDSVDGRTPAPVIGSLSHYLQGCFTSQVVRRISEPSTVCLYGQVWHFS